MPVRIILADDHGVLRAGLRSLLESEAEFIVVAEAWEGEQVLRLAAKHKPELVLLDLNMPGPSNAEVTRRLLEVAPGCRVLILTGYEETGLVREVIKAGASGYIIKRALESELLNAIHAVHRGEMYVDPSMTRALLKASTPELAPKPAQQDAVLTARETVVLRFIAQGYTNRQIGEELKISIRTVESHRANLMSKLGFQTRVELVRYANEHGLLK